MSTCGENKRHGFLKEYREGEERFCLLFHLLLPALSAVEGLDEFLQEGLRELWLPVLRQAEFPQHLRGIRLSLSLRVSSLVLQAGGKILFVEQ